MKKYQEIFIKIPFVLFSCYALLMSLILIVAHLSGVRDFSWFMWCLCWFNVIAYSWFLFDLTNIKKTNKN